MRKKLDHPLDEAIAATGEHLLELYCNDEQLRRNLRNVISALGNALMEGIGEDEESQSDKYTAEPPKTDTNRSPLEDPEDGQPTSPPEAPAPPSSITRSGAPSGDAETQRSLVYSTDPGDRYAMAVAAQASGTMEDDWDPTIGRMETISQALALKAEASAFALEMFETGEDLFTLSDLNLERKDELIQRTAPLGKCFLWMLKHATPSEATAPDWALLIRSYEAASEAAKLLAHQCELNKLDDEAWKELLTLCAQAQSALRANVLRTGQQFDPHQLEMFKWIRRFAKQQHHYIERYMREEDVAAPEDWADLLEMLHSFEERVKSRVSVEKDRRNLEGKLRYHIDQLGRCTPEQRKSEWTKIMMAVDGLVRLGMPPSDTSLREALLPLVDEIPELDDEPHNFELVIREIDTYLSRIPVDSSRSSIEATISQDIEEVRALLSGTTVVLIGGEPRNDAKRALEEAFDLAELDWILGKHHSSIFEFRPNILREETVLVLLAIRWSSHSFSDVKEFCDEANKPLVRLPAGYNPNQVAHQILQQAGGILSKNLPR